MMKCMIVWRVNSSKIREKQLESDNLTLEEAAVNYNAIAKVKVPVTRTN